MKSPTRLDPEIVAFFIGPEPHTSTTPNLAIIDDDKGIGQRGMDKVHPASGLFPPSSFYQALFAMWLIFCYSLPVTAALARCYPLACSCYTSISHFPIHQTGFPIHC
jgi:hypothetical protein